MVVLVEAETNNVYQEARSVLGSFITQLISIFRRILDFALAVSRMVINYASEHPLGAVLLACNIMIWVS